MAPSNVLVIDSDAGLRNTLVDLFALEGYPADEADDLTNAVALLANRDYGLVVSYSLSSSWNEASIGRIRELVKAAGRTPVVLVTGHSQAQELDLPAEGLAAVVSKPFDIDQFLTIVHEHLVRGPDA